MFTRLFLLCFFVGVGAAAEGDNGRVLEQIERVRSVAPHACLQALELAKAAGPWREAAASGRPR